MQRRCHGVTRGGLPAWIPAQARLRTAARSTRVDDETEGDGVSTRLTGAEFAPTIARVCSLRLGRVLWLILSGVLCTCEPGLDLQGHVFRCAVDAECGAGWRCDTTSALCVTGPRDPGELGPPRLGVPHAPLPNWQLEPAGEQQARARADAYDGGWWVVWQDHRRTVHFADVYAARVSTSGQVLDPRGVALGTYAYDDWTPDVACGPTVCLAAWRTDVDTRGVRLSFDGAVLDQPPLILDDLPSGHVVAPVIHVDDAGFQVVWSHRTSLSRRTVSPSGVMSAKLTAPAAPQAWLAAELDGDRQVVAYPASTDEIHIAAFGTGGLSTPQVVAMNARRPAIGSVGQQLVVAWNDRSTARPPGVRLLGRDLTPLGPPMTVGDAGAVEVTAASTRDEVVLLYRIPSGALWTASVTADGGVGGARVASTADAGQLEAAFAGSTASAVVFMRATVSDDVFLARWEGGAVDAAEVRVAWSGEAQLEPSLAAGRSGAAVAYAVQGASARIELLHVDGSGKELGAPTVVATSPGALGSPRVAWDGEAYNVAWLDRSRGGWYLRRYDESGDALGGELALASSSSGAFALTSIAGATLACWEQPGQGLRGRLVFTDGGVGAELPLSGGRAGSCAAAGFGDGFLVAWLGAGNELSWRLVDHLGRLGGSDTLPDSGSSLTTTLPLEVSVAASPQNYLVSWRRSSPFVLESVRVAHDGGLLDARGIVLFTRTESPLQGEGRQPVTAFDGHDYLVAWDNTFADGGSDILLRKMRPDGTLSATTQLASGEANQERSALARLSPGRVLAAYSEYEPVGGPDSLRLRTRLVADVRDGEACAGSFECREGTCQGGRCCIDCGERGGQYEVACGCNAGGPGAGLLALLFVAVVRRRAHG